MKKIEKYIILVISLIAVGAIVTAIYFGMNNNDNENTLEQNKSETEITKSIKNDKDKAYVYNADYKLPVDKEYYENYGVTIYANDIVVPYVNINSASAKKVNQEIYKLYENLIRNYNNYVNDKSGYTLVDYKVYEINDILSIVITTESGGTDVAVENYYTYNFNLLNGNLMTYKDTYEKMGYTEDSINKLSTLAITKEMKNQLKDFKYPDNYPEGTNFDTYNDKSIKNYIDSVEKEELNFYIDGNRNLNIIVTLNIPVGIGEFNSIIKID